MRLPLALALACTPALATSACKTEPAATGAGEGATATGDSSGTGTTGEPDTTSSTGPGDGLTPVPAEPQRPGDAAAGYHALVNNGYVSCGIPWTAYAKVFGDAPASQQLPGREGKNATLVYNQTWFVAKSGVELVSANCLQCHAGEINGQLVVGLGNAAGDFTGTVGSTAALAGVFLSDSVEKAELQRFVDRLGAIEPYTQTLSVGVNPADNLAAILFSHRDPKTLAWSDAPLLEPPPAVVIPLDVPPWWFMKKKNAMLYNAAGRGDHSRTMMAASTLCTDDIDEARAIDAYFPDVRAYILSIEPPPYPFAVDAALAAAGAEVFAANCSTCHGTYGAGGEGDTYPNLVVDLDVIGTDPELANGASYFAGRFVDWFNNSFYGEVARLEPQSGYIAPPLDGVWASAPYLHNGSVPTVAAVLESGARPKYWTRTFDSTDYDPVALGWNHTVVDHGHADEPSADLRRKIYDTTEVGYSNAGHPFGDALSPGDRAAVIEYLKTL